jgi:uncharacterized membrane protein YgdD (TMEM256/DUF423 family)
VNERVWIGLAAAYGFLAVACGAFGAHALRARLDADLLAVWRTAVEYHFYHALGIYASLRPARALDVAGMCFAAGIVLFSGSLYALTLTGVRALGAITPIGGLLFLAGWGALGWSVWRR